MKFFQGGFLTFTVFLLCAGINSPRAAASQFQKANMVQPPSPYTLAGIDFLLPGYGMYMQNEKWQSAAYFGLNIVSLTTIYFAYRHWRLSEAAYQTDKGQELENRAGRSQLFFAASILANVVIRSLSAWHTFAMANTAVKEAGPRYEFYPDAQGGVRSKVAYRVYF